MTKIGLGTIEEIEGYLRGCLGQTKKDPWGNDDDQDDSGASKQDELIRHAPIQHCIF